MWPEWIWVQARMMSSMGTPKSNMDTLGIEPRASRMLSGCDTTTPCAQLLAQQLCLLEIQAGRLSRRPVWEKMMHGR